LKREKKAAAIKARIDGKIAANERREKEEQAHINLFKKKLQPLVKRWAFTKTKKPLLPCAD
jgi:hypothetical protein